MKQTHCMKTFMKEGIPQKQKKCKEKLKTSSTKLVFIRGLS